MTAVATAANGVSVMMIRIAGNARHTGKDSESIDELPVRIPAPLETTVPGRSSSGRAPRARSSGSGSGERFNLPFSIALGDA